MNVIIYMGELDALKECQKHDVNDAFISKLEEIYTAALKDEKSIPSLAADVEVSLTFLNPQKMAEINCEYRDVSEPTDVLSFPMWEDEDGCFVPPDDWEVIPLGDIMVCPDVVEKNAAENGRTFLEETVLVISHGLLHLMGRDHDTEERKNEMWAEQNMLVKMYFNGIKQ